MKSPAFQFYPDKWQTDTRRLSWEAKGIYHELMCVVWLQFQDTCTFPDDDVFISSEIGCTIDEWKKTKAELLNPFRPILVSKETNRLFLPGLWKEVVKQEDRRERLRLNGCKGGRPKNQKVISEKANTHLSDKSLVIFQEPKKRLPSPSPSPTVVLEEREKEFAETPPMSRKDFDAMAEIRGIPKDCADHFWNTYDARNWVDSRGIAVRKVEPLLQNYAVTWRANASQNKAILPNDHQPSAATTVQMNKEYERVIERIRKIQDGAASNAMGERFYTEKEKAQLNVLRSRRDELRQTLGIVI